LRVCPWGQWPRGWFGHPKPTKGVAEIQIETYVSSAIQIETQVLKNKVFKT
jgi:hypothetical protein